MLKTCLICEDEFVPKEEEHELCLKCWSKHKEEIEEYYAIGEHYDWGDRDG